MFLQQIFNKNSAWKSKEEKEIFFCITLDPMISHHIHDTVRYCWVSSLDKILNSK